MKSKPIVLLDFDGTLCHTEPAISHSIKTTFLRRNLAQPEQAKITNLIGSGCGLVQLIESLHPAPKSLSQTDSESWANEYRAIYREEGEALVSLFEGVHSILDRLRKNNRLVIVSNKAPSAIDHSLEGFAIKHFFEAVFGAEAHLPKKPDAKLFHQLIAPRLNLDASSECFFVGDTSADLLFAKNIGVTSFYAGYGYGDDAQCEAIGYHARLNQFADLQHLLV